LRWECKSESNDLRCKANIENNDVLSDIDYIDDGEHRHSVVSHGSDDADALSTKDTRIIFMKNCKKIIRNE